MSIINNQLSPEEKRRYSRHLLLDNVGVSGQEKLKQAKVLVIGAGGLGCPVLQYLTAAGVGTIGIIDFDVVEESNLQRQILFTIADIGKNKARAAKERLKQLNQFVQLVSYEEKLTTKNALQLIDQYDIVVDGSDNFETRYLVNDASVITNTPLVYGAIYKFEGQVSVFNYLGGPSYRCLFPNPPKAGNVPNCSEVGVIGVLPGLIGVQQANEVLKIILNIGTTLSGKLLMYDALGSETTYLQVDKSKDEVERVLASEAHFKNIDYAFFCGIDQNENQEIEMDEFLLICSDDNIQIIDVRNDWEQPRIDHLNPIIAPLRIIESIVSEISKTKKVVVCCQHGIRSRSAIELLGNEHNFNNLINLKDGLASYKN
jgi:sulfur-carrier protein adenylyltransferase/sulfurtransferase